MARCRVALRQQPQLAGCPVITVPWVMRVVGVVDSPLYGRPWVILEWYTDDPAQMAGCQWEPGTEPPNYRTLAEWQARRADEAAYQAQCEGRMGDRT